MAEKQSNHLDVSPAEVDAILLTVRTAELVAKVSNKFKYALGGPAIQAAQRAGSEIGKGFRAYALREKLNRYREANEALGDRIFRLRMKERFCSSINSYMSIFRHCNAYGLRKQVVRQVLESPWSDLIVAAPGATHIAVRPDMTRRAHLTRKNRKLKHQILHYHEQRNPTTT